MRPARRRRRRRGAALRAGRAAHGRAACMRARRSDRRRRSRRRARSSGCGSKSRRSAASSSPCALPDLSSANAPRPRSPCGAARRANRSGSVRSRSKVFSTLIEIRATSCSSPRGSIPRARSRSTLPTLPGSNRRSSSSSSRQARRPSRHCRRGAALAPSAPLRVSGARRARRGTTPPDRERRPLVRGACARHWRPCDDLARRDAERARQARPGADGRLHRLSDDARLEEVARDPRRGRG